MVAALAAAATVAAVSALSAPAYETGGPLADATPMAYPWLLEPGQAFTDAMVVFTPAAGPVTLIAVEPEYGDGLESAGIWLATADRDVSDGGVARGQYDQAPPRDSRLGQLIDPEGYVLPTFSQADVGTQLIAGTKMTKPGRHLLNGYWVTYEYDGKTYRDRVRMEITLCSPEGLNESGDCEMLGELAKEYRENEQPGQ